MSTEDRTELGNLVINRSVGQVLWIGDVRMEIVSLKGDTVKLAMNGPRNIKILRDELRPIPEHEAVALLESAKTPEGWNGFVDKILRSYKGVYPDYWVRVIIESGLMKRVTDKF